MTSLIAAIRSGGQTGVDRGALDAARAAGVTIEGWCPAGGWAEDLPGAPGLLTDYPESRETPSPEPAQRTEWNVRDSEVTLIISPDTVKSWEVVYLPSAETV
ncbi:MAG: YpsA SLOG family protein, partial [Brevibacterium aurantiacum]